VSIFGDVAMSALRASWLAWGAVVALLAYPAQAQVIGQESAILGGESGFFRPTAGGEDTVTIDAMPYTRTVTCDTYTVTGTYTGTAPTTWSASPSGDTGSCTDLGGGTFSCDVDVDPDASGEGVETITIGNDSVDIGFYVSGSHSCFLAQSVDGSYNSTLADNDPVATWENLGTSALDVTQGTAVNQPTFKTSIVNGSPVVRADGNDNLSATTASDWTYLHDGTGMTIDAIALMTSGSAINNIATTSTGSGSNRGIGWRTVSTAATSFYLSDGAALRINVASANDVFTAGTFNNHMVMLASADTPDHTQYINGTSVQSGNSSAAFSSSDPANPLFLFSTPAPAFPLTGDVFRVVIYASALTSTQRAINQSVDEWALGGTLPVTP
jgi:hypothetical protein